jgi:hypothetical protein
LDALCSFLTLSIADHTEELRVSDLFSVLSVSSL